MNGLLSGSKIKRIVYRHCVAATICTMLLLFSACAQTRPLQPKTMQQTAASKYLSDSIFVNNCDTFVQVENEYSIEWQTKDYRQCIKQYVEKKFYPWRNIQAYDIIQYFDVSQETRDMIYKNGGVRAIIHSFLSKESCENAHRKGGPIEFKVYFVVSLADMKILAYGFELSWEDKSKQLSSMELEKILDFIHTIQLSYSGGEEYRNETVALFINLHRLSLE